VVVAQNHHLLFFTTTSRGRGKVRLDLGAAVGVKCMMAHNAVPPLDNFSSEHYVFHIWFLKEGIIRGLLGERAVEWTIPELSRFYH